MNSCITLLVLPYSYLIYLICYYVAAKLLLFLLLELTESLLFIPFLDLTYKNNATGCVLSLV